MKEFEIPTDKKPFELDEGCVFYSDHYGLPNKFGTIF